MIDVLNTGLEVGTIIVVAWSKVSAAAAQKSAKEANVRTQQIQNAVQPNGDTLHQIAGQNLSLLRSMSKILEEQNRLIRQIITTDRYLHRRNHAILNGIFKIALGNAVILRKLGVDVPDPEPPLPDDFDTKDDPPPL